MKIPAVWRERRDKKNDWRDGLRNAIYTLIVSLISPTFFRILVNLTISVWLAYVKHKKIVVEMKEILDAAYESAMSHASVYCWYKDFKSSRKSVELMGEPSAFMTVLTEQSTLV